MPKLKVGGIEVQVPAGATVLQACEIAGEEIPRFCYTICALGDAAAWPIQGLIKHFRPEMERRITEKRGGGLSPMMEAAE